MKAQIEIFVLFVCLKRIIIRIYVFLWLYTSFIINPMKKT
ncbi:hypothetical protein FORC13_4056 [Bacillus cereus]|nr:hypothetical protein FORC13_4056 [Bacillus cereus]SME18715.1 hypothetical protein BACERE00184_03615 [Bacillus cereus]